MDYGHYRITDIGLTCCHPSCVAFSRFEYQVFYSWITDRVELVPHWKDDDAVFAVLDTLCRERQIGKVTPRGAFWNLCVTRGYRFFPHCMRLGWFGWFGTQMNFRIFALILYLSVGTVQRKASGP